jgi:hypothetical protein
MGTMARTTRHARTTREHTRADLTCAYADPVTDRLRARLRLRVSPLPRDRHAAAPFVVVQFDDGFDDGRSRPATPIHALAGDPEALRAFVRKVLDRP